MVMAALLCCDTQALCDLFSHSDDTPTPSLNDDSQQDRGY